MTESELIYAIKRNACSFFWDRAHPKSGLINDRAKNNTEDSYNIASIASTGYGLASLAVAVENGWRSHETAYERALTTLRFLYFEMPQVRGWFFHFVDKNTGERVWHSELSSIDTALLIAGALVCGQYFKGTEVEELSGKIYARIDWQWMLTNGNQQPDKLFLSHGWTPESGFLKYNWDSYCELMFLYLLGMGAENNALPLQCWDAWYRPVVAYKGLETLVGGPIFIHQMSHGFYDFKDHCDRSGWNYHTTSIQATLINRQFCIDNMDHRKTYSPDIWGINACDYPGGYKAFAAPGEEDGTVSPSGAVASVIFTPDLSIRAAVCMYSKYGDRIWGKFGFANAFNVDLNWYDPDVIGIDLGMALLNLENASTGLIWTLLASHPSTSRGWNKAGLILCEKNLL